MRFADPGFLWLWVLIVPMALLVRRERDRLHRYFAPAVLKRIRYSRGVLPKKVRDALLIGAFALGVVALARPVVDRGEIKVHSSDIDVIAAFDISQSMFADDIYPSRFALAKRKFDAFLGDLPQARVGVIGFSSRAFLVSPLTKDFASLRFLVHNMKLEYVSLKGTDIMSALEVTQRLLKKSRKKALLLFTDGGDKHDYAKEIAYAKRHGISVFVYAIGTDKGGVIKTPHGVLKDKKGDIVVVRRNDAIKALALRTGGAYMRYSLERNDIKALAQNIRAKFKEGQKHERTIRDTKELFVYPLGLAMLLFWLSFSSLPRRERLKEGVRA